MANKSIGHLADRVSGIRLVLLLILITITFAIIYLCLSNYCPAHGLVNGEENEISFMDALYFSIITETTLGYGDITPVGFARFLSCIQVIAGLVFAGIAVAKITSASGKKMRTIERKAVGYWIEPFRTEGKETLFTFTQIYIDGGQLKYRGDNFDAGGNFNDSFKGEFIGEEDNTLKFSYHNPIKNNLFDSGVIELMFTNMNKKGQWLNHNSIGYDHKKSEKTIIHGKRASDKEIEIFNNNKIEERKAIIKLCIEDFNNTIPIEKK